MTQGLRPLLSQSLLHPQLAINLEPVQSSKDETMQLFGVGWTILGPTCCHAL